MNEPELDVRTLAAKIRFQARQLNGLMTTRGTSVERGLVLLEILSDIAAALELIEDRL